MRALINMKEIREQSRKNIKGLENVRMNFYIWNIKHSNYINQLSLIRALIIKIYCSFILIILIFELEGWRNINDSWNQIHRQILVVLINVNGYSLYGKRYNRLETKIYNLNIFRKRWMVLESREVLGKKYREFDIWLVLAN